MTPIEYIGSWLGGMRNRFLFGFNSGGQIQQGVTGDGFFVPVGMTNNVLTLQDYKDFDNVFFQSPTLQTIIVNKGQCKINAKWDLYKKNGSVSNSPRANEIRAKMVQPNVLMNYSQFRFEVNNICQVHGFCILWFVPNGSKFGTGFQNIWPLNPADLVITYKQSGKYVYQTKLEDIIESIKLNYAGGQIDVPLSEIAFVKDQAATKSTAGMYPPLVPTSRMYGMKMVLSNSMAAYDARNSMATDRGMTGFLANSSKDKSGFIPMLEGEKEELKNNLMRYGINRGQKKLFFTNADLRFVSTVVPTKDLMLFEETEETMCRMVDVYGYQIQLLATSKTSSIGSQNETQKEARKNLYQNTIIPEDINEMPAIFSKFGLENDGLEVKTDYSHIEELKANEVESEAIRTARIANIDTINKMTVDYDTKINIACEVLQISTEEASKIISKDDTSSTSPGQDPAIPAAA